MRASATRCSPSPSRSSSCRSRCRTPSTSCGRRCAQFFAFAICFALLFQVWWRHFNFFRRYGLEDVPTIVLTGILLFVVLFYVYPLKFVFTLVVNQIIGVPASHDGTGGPVIRTADTPRLMQIYSGGVVAVFSMFALMYANAFRQRAAARAGRPAAARGTTQHHRQRGNRAHRRRVGASWRRSADRGRRAPSRDRCTS